MPGWSHEPVWDRHLLSHWPHNNFPSEPACCFITFTFALHGFSVWLFKMTVFPHLVISALASGLHCIKCALRLSMRDFTRMLLFCTIVIMIKALSQYLGILPTVSCLKSMTARHLLKEFWCTRKPSWSAICTTESRSQEGNFSAHRCALGTQDARVFLL